MRIRKPSVTGSESEVRDWELPRDAMNVNAILSALWTKEGAWGIWKGV